MINRKKAASKHAFLLMKSITEYHKDVPLTILDKIVVMTIHECVEAGI